MSNSKIGPESTPSATPEIEVKLDANVGQGFDGAMNAISKVFEGIAGAAKKAIGPELFRNMQVANWLRTVADCLDETATILRESRDTSGKAGELAYHCEQLAVEVGGSKFESQQASFKQRLDAALAALEATADSTGLAKVASAAGYFRAAANSVSLPPTMTTGPVQITPS